MKRCSKCDHVKPLSSFHKAAANEDGRTFWCKDCKRSARVVSYQNTKAETKTYAAKWAKDNPDKVAVYRRKSLVRLYGITWEQYQELIRSQGNRCAICRTDKPGKRLRTWMIDHCHETGAVRGILCENCNRALGMMQDDPARLRAAAAYLERAKTLKAA